ncbi:hypothetical protein ACFY05_01005 [Microtetraspora fusca]|uniref:Uncharacterized protein n=1 Tax=Microtetraspora fusca TaxID=1997 RepID=A0ABW6UWJ0_MICFU
MVNTPTTPHNPLINLQEVRNQHRYTTTLIDAHPRTRPMLRTTPGAAIITALDSIPALCDEVERLHVLLSLVRLEYADMVAAARATIAADREGEPDSLYYLRDELSARGLLPSGTPGPRSGGGAAW